MSLHGIPITDADDPRLVDGARGYWVEYRRGTEFTLGRNFTSTEEVRKSIRKNKQGMQFFLTEEYVDPDDDLAESVALVFSISKINAKQIVKYLRESDKLK